MRINRKTNTPLNNGIMITICIVMTVLLIVAIM